MSTVAPVAAATRRSPVSAARSRWVPRARTQWLALAAALVVLAGVVVAWGLGEAADRVPVVQVARPVRAGDVLSVDDLAVVGVAHDAGVTGLVPAASLEQLAGRVAAIDLTVGVLVQHGMWREAPALLEGEQSVGAVLAIGRFPDGLAAGDFAEVVDLDGAAASPRVTVRVVQVDLDEEGRLVLTLAALRADAPVVARLAASERMALLGQPVVTP